MKQTLGRTVKSPVAKVVGVALVALSVGAAYALAGPTGTITACVHHTGGGLYIGHCATGDRSITWNARGPRGPQGPPGPTASSWAQLGTAQLSNGNPASVDLTSGGGEIKTAYPSRIQASSTATYFVPLTETGDDATVACALYLLNGVNSTPMGSSSVTIPPSAHASYGTIAVVGSQDVPAGTYNVQLQCLIVAAQSTAATVNSDGGNLNVIDIAR